MKMCKMRRIRLWMNIMLAMALLLIAHVSTAEEQQNKGTTLSIKKKVIVGAFEDKADHRWYRGTSPGDGMADMLITALVKSEKFRVYERAAMDEILKEKGMSYSDLANPGLETSKKLEIGDMLVKATITEFGYKEKEIGGGVTKKFIKKVKLVEYTARVAVDLRLISVGTSEVLWAGDVHGTETSRSLGVKTEDFSFGDKKHFDEHIVGKATRKVINEIVEKLGEETKNIPWTGILIVADEFLFIDAGNEIGIVPGMQFDVQRVQKVVKHPKTGKVLKVLRDTLGVVKATEVEEGVTTVEALSGEGFQNGDMVIFKKAE